MFERVPVETSDGLILSARVFRSQTNHDHAVVIGSATGVLQRYYERYARYLAENGSQWCKSPNYLFDHIEKEKRWFRDLTFPLTSVSFADDPFAPVAAVAWLAAKYVKADLEHLHFSPADQGVSELGHFSFFKEAFREHFWECSLQWLTRSVAKPDTERARFN